MAERKKSKVSDNKVKEVKKLAELIDSNNTIMLASIKGLPTRQFQKIKKTLSDKVIIKVIKKRAVTRAIESSKKQNISELKKYLKEDVALLLSQIDVFELSAILSDNKNPVKAKAGQEAESDIEIEAGVTEIPAGPAISELGSLGLQVQVKEGKIEIVKDKVIVKKGQKISETAASVMGKLSISPFNVGFIPLSAYDSKSGKIFDELKIDKQETINELKGSFAKAKAFAVYLGYISIDTIGALIAKAVSYEKAIEGLIKDDNTNQNEQNSGG